MKFKATLSIILSALLMLGCASCVWSTKPLDHEKIPLKDDTTEEAKDSTTEPTSDTVPSDSSMPEYSELGENLQFFHTPNDDCVIVYNHENAWAFDYKLNKVTKLTDLDAMYTVADITGRGKEYFESVTLDVEFEMRGDYEIQMIYTVNSDVADAYYKVYSFYTLDNAPISKRGDVRGYFYEDIKYPGYDEPLVIYDVEDLGLLTKNNAVMEDYYSRIIRALVKLDIPELEKIMGATEGLLSEWENVVISDYSIANEYPSNPYNNELLVTINITESTIESYPVGEHKIRVAEGIGPVFHPVSSTFDDRILTGAEEFVYTWASRFGGSYPIELQTFTSDSGFPHEVVDFYLNRETEAPTLERFAEFCEKTFGYSLAGSGISRASVEQHGGHGGTGVLCEITEVVSSGNNYVIEISFFADELKSVVAKIHRFHVIDSMDGFYRITSCESVYDAGLRIDGWSA